MRRSATALPNPSELTIRLETGATTTALVYRACREIARRDGATLILGHGAGAGQRSAFMVDFAAALSALGVDVVTFNFLYTRAGTQDSRSRAGARGLLSRGDRRRSRRVSRRRDSALFIGGKSMGGRIATQVAAADPALQLAGLVLLGYPLHPPGKAGPAPRQAPAGDRAADAVRAGHARRVRHAGRARADPWRRCSRRRWLHVVAQGDHSFKLSRKDPAAQAAVYADVQRAIVSFVSSAP